jgi:hypothetical protein
VSITAIDEEHFITGRAEGMGVVKLLAIFIIIYVYTGLQATEHLLLRAAAHH